MMKRFTLTMMGLLLLLGGVSLQAQTVNLPIKGGTNWEASENQAEANPKWTPSDDGHTSGIVYFKESRSPKYCRLGGTVWHANYSTGTQHIFSITLNNSFDNQYNQQVTNLASGFVLVAVKGGDYSNNELTDNEANWNNNDFRTDGNGSSTLKVVASATPQVSFVNNQLQFELTVEENYDAVYFYATDCNYKFIKIESITRTIITASSVASPMISPASGTYDGDLSVTITKGEGNDKVFYSVSGATTGNETDAEFTTASKTLTLTGTGTITVTAKGVVGSDESDVVTNTYTYSIPSGVISVWTGPTDFADGEEGWKTNVEISNSNFSNLEVGDYIYLYATHTGVVPNIGFRNNWDDSVLKKYTETSSGNAAYGNMTADESFWWVKITDTDLLNIFKTGQPRIQGQSFTLTKVEIHKAMTLSANADNDITKCTDMIVTVDRPFVAGTWNTVCLPFVPTADQANTLFGSGYKLAAFTGVSGTTMQFTTTSTFEAGVPYLVKPTDGCATAAVTFNDVDITAKTPQPVTYGGYSFVGKFTQKTFSGDECNSSLFVATGNELKKPDEGSTLKSLRCYFTVPAGSIAAARSFTVDEEATGVDSVQSSQCTVHSYYNLNGQRVDGSRFRVNGSGLKPGLYIVNGKKVVIK